MQIGQLNHVFHAYGCPKLIIIDPTDDGMESVSQISTIQPSMEVWPMILHFEEETLKTMSFSGDLT